MRCCGWSPTRARSAGTLQRSLLRPNPPDSTGAIWVGWGGPCSTARNGSESGRRTSSTNVKAGAERPQHGRRQILAVPHGSLPDGQLPRNAVVSGFGSFQCSLQGRTFDVDLTNDDVYADQGTKIVPYSKGVAGDPVHQNGPAFGAGKLTQSLGIDIDNAGTVTAGTSGNKVVRFEKGATCRR